MLPLLARRLEHSFFFLLSVINVLLCTFQSGFCEQHLDGDNLFHSPALTCSIFVCATAWAQRNCPCLKWKAKGSATSESARKQQVAGIRLLTERRRNRRADGRVSNASLRVEKENGRRLRHQPVHLDIQLVRDNDGGVQEEKEETHRAPSLPCVSLQQRLRDQFVTRITRRRRRKTSRLTTFVQSYPIGHKRGCPFVFENPLSKPKTGFILSTPSSTSFARHWPLSQLNDDRLLPSSVPFTSPQSTLLNSSVSSNVNTLHKAASKALLSSYPSHRTQYLPPSLQCQASRPPCTGLFLASSWLLSLSLADRPKRQLLTPGRATAESVFDVPHSDRQQPTEPANHSQQSEKKDPSSISRSSSVAVLPPLVPAYYSHRYSLHSNGTSALPIPSSCSCSSSSSSTIDREIYPRSPGQFPEDLFDVGIIPDETRYKIFALKRDLLAKKKLRSTVLKDLFELVVSDPNEMRRRLETLQAPGTLNLTQAEVRLLLQRQTTLILYPERVSETADFLLKPDWNIDRQLIRYIHRYPRKSGNRHKFIWEKKKTGTSEATEDSEAITLDSAEQSRSHSSNVASSEPLLPSKTTQSLSHTKTRPYEELDSSRLAAMECLHRCDSSSDPKGWSRGSPHACATAGSYDNDGDNDRDSFNVAYDIERGTDVILFPPTTPSKEGLIPFERIPLVPNSNSTASWSVDQVHHMLLACPSLARKGPQTLSRRFTLLQNECGLSPEEIVEIGWRRPTILEVGRPDLRVRYLVKKGWFTWTQARKLAKDWPQLLTYDMESTIRPKMLYLLDYMDKTPQEVLSFPDYLSYHLRKRIMPRHMAFVIRHRQAVKRYYDSLAFHDLEPAVVNYLDQKSSLEPPCYSSSSGNYKAQQTATNVAASQPDSAFTSHPDTSPALLPTSLSPPSATVTLPSLEEMLVPPDFWFLKKFGVSRVEWVAAHMQVDRMGNIQSPI